MKQPPHVDHVCRVCGKTCHAAPEAVVTCVHGDTPMRLRPPAIATPTETQP